MLRGAGDRAVTPREEIVVLRREEDFAVRTNGEADRVAQALVTAHPANLTIANLPQCSWARLPPNWRSIGLGSNPVMPGLPPRDVKGQVAVSLEAARRIVGARQ